MLCYQEFTRFTLRFHLLITLSQARMSCLCTQLASLFPARAALHTAVNQISDSENAGVHALVRPRTLLFSETQTLPKMCTAWWVSLLRLQLHTVCTAQLRLWSHIASQWLPPLTATCLQGRIRLLLKITGMVKPRQACCTGTCCSSQVQISLECMGDCHSVSA